MPEWELGGDTNEFRDILHRLLTGSPLLPSPSRCLHQHLPQATVEDLDVDVVTDVVPVVDLDVGHARTRKPSGEQN